MEFKNVLETRRSHRKYAEGEIPAEAVKEILDAALMAPAGKRANAWEFITVTDRATLEKLSLCRQFGSAFVAGAPLCIVVCADTTKTDVWVEDCTIAAIYMQLTAENLGYGSCWAQVRRRESREEGVSAEAYIKGILGIPENYAVECMICVGGKVEEKRPFDPSRLQREKIHSEKF